ncbi:hypothetical protein TVAG_018950 [Trichomonas vaginalis G3]|uniref:Uncharacterized protein n=1 Tax=Trichomonas vaginalis (strain ATCC PRA-98 / G3) TaxID=412133 RepID=A2G495_TRIV3|nr:hypothetical protein TVAGG3_0215640 [Trichomonas vaginalis G3]EAX88023.1 hypothetical protein TVAG_018950 [Trichomonas vaginalis G3]KAI5551542.1 hypothetical protein TVAGG3_0215640 [Trichomonas vaginalis G3]|eukprot:XP_001300953.1 hypothetical protein [Trichomonas vaginalis G3]
MIVTDHNGNAQKRENAYFYRSVVNRCSYPLHEATHYPGQVYYAQKWLNSINFMISNRDIDKYYSRACYFYQGIIFYLDMRKFSEEEISIVLEIFVNLSNEVNKYIQPFLANYKTHVRRIYYLRHFNSYFEEKLNESILILTKYIYELMNSIQKCIKLIWDKYHDKVYPGFMKSDYYKSIFIEKEFFLDQIDPSPPYFYGQKEDYDYLTDKQNSPQLLLLDTQTSVSDEKESQIEQSNIEIVEKRTTNIGSPLIA